ncbi:MAG TPA: tRNA (adenosine(37)-N6)-threonylcarbamoyltransferase complex ATPase subunit type 1 TsaE [Candidatus Ozemobacteraceae bacterium]|nr:tRNA (adenosine(37)-N6)-threonylcarbamoyltransferase complex ATPase subunit type 1 TsaE [Candidatus Ozemobacteraceae bacterium]
MMPHLPPTPLSSGSPEDTLAHAERMARAFPHSLVLLYGGMGAGKTLWAKGFAAGLGFGGDVYSPTYTIMNIYHEGGLTLHHLDLYRVGCFEEVVDLGLFEILDARHPCVIEWPERVATLAELPHLEIRLEPGDGPDHRILHWRHHEGSRLS